MDRSYQFTQPRQTCPPQNFNKGTGRYSGDSIRSTAKDLAKGLGMPYVPGEKRIAAVNIDRVRRERRLALGSMLNSRGQSSANAIAAILKFPNIKKR